MNQDGKLEELVHEMEKYRWNLLDLCEIRWKNLGEWTTDERHKLYYSGKDNKHEQGVVPRLSRPHGYC